MSKSGSSMESSLWMRWEKTRLRVGPGIVLIDAKTGTSHSANDLHAAALAFSENLAALSVGDRVAFRLPNCLEWMACFLAIQKRGLTAIPLDHGMPSGGCVETARYLGARLLYLDGKFQEVDSSVRHRAGVCCLKTTSGSTGMPKAIACREGHLMADGENVIRTMGIRGTDRNLAAIPLGHSYGLGNLVMPLILQGTGMVCADAYTPRQLVEWMDQYHVTVFPGVPTLFRVLASLPAGISCPSLRTAISAGARLDPEIAKAFFQRFGRRLHNFYGSSETGGICYDRPGSASLSGRSIGRPMNGVKVTIAKGRITVASGAVATRTGRWRPEDRGEWNTRDELVLLGRGGKNANIGGKKVHPLEIENVLRSLPGVTDAVVWLHPHEGRDLLAAGVESPKTQTQIEQAIALRLPAWKMPRWYLLARQLPRTPRGKLDMKILRSRIKGPSSID